MKKFCLIKSDFSEKSETGNSFNLYKADNGKSIKNGIEKQIKRMGIENFLFKPTSSS
jgi:hypothetical protein